MFATAPDLLRLLAIPFFGYVAWRDVRTRRVPNRTWYPLAALAVVLLVWDAYVVYTGGVTTFQRQIFPIQVAVSLGVVAPLAYLFWRIGGFGGADAKAFIVVAVLFPTYPAYAVGELGLPVATLPVVVTALGVFSLTVLSNTVLVGLAYPFVLAARNALRGRLSPAMFVARPIRSERATAEYGSLLHFSDRSLRSNLSPAGLREHFTFRGLDLDALRMYLRWRGVTLEELREEPETFRDPTSLPDRFGDPGDGAIVTDGGTAGDAMDVDETDGKPTGVGDGSADPWGAAAFVDAVDGDAYGTDAATLREGLDELTTTDYVWISPGIPFLVPLFVGLLVALTYGDLLFALLGVLGFV